VLAAALVVAMVLALSTLLALRVRVHAQVRATADSEGDWRAAAGGALGPLTFTAGVSPAGAAWTARLLGRTVARGTRVPRAKRAGLSPLGALVLGRRALRRVRFDRVDARVHGAAGDPATSAQLLGFIVAAAAVLSPRARIAGDVDWMADQPFLNIDCDLDASFLPAVVGWDVMRARLTPRGRRGQGKNHE
jgi:hypothetical protein